ncbi:MAG TPA: ankyrin repeat domain-containing protein [Thermoanaerobaculia bacterium]|jgi:ankyrin repeat protein|nr:ankyrin repeat domain-containing protein [Thermoanaerobaculia bacterium]
MSRPALISVAVMIVLLPATALLWLVSRPRPHLETPLETAAVAGSAERVKAALAAGARPDDLDRYGFTPLVYAARGGRTEAMTLLLQAGADPDLRDDYVNGWTPLLHAVHKEQLAAVRALLTAGAAVDRPGRNGLTPLMLAAAQGNAEIAEALLAAGADPRAVSPGAGSVLSQAIWGDNPRIVKDLLRIAPDLHLGDGWGDRLTRAYARLRGHAELVARLDTLRREIR